MSVFENTNEMYVTKRNGNHEIISFDKILQRIKKVGKEANIQINYTSLVMKIIDQLYDKIPTDKIDEISAEQCASMSSIHTDYGVLASRLIISNHHRNTTASFSKTMKKLHGENIVCNAFMQDVQANAKALDAMIDYQRDYLIDYFGFKTLERSYLLSIKKRVHERPQMMFMRLTVAMHGTDLARIQETYDAFSNKLMIHGTPSLYNAGTPRQQMSSCFVKGTVVHTLRGGVPIQEVQVGDRVITHTGKVSKVTQLHTNRLGDRRLRRLQCYQTRPITVTEDHNLYVYHSATKTVGWKAAGQLTQEDYVMVPNNRDQPMVTDGDNAGKTLAMNLNINKFFGIWMRYGDFMYDQGVDAKPYSAANASQDQDLSSNADVTVTMKGDADASDVDLPAPAPKLVGVKVTIPANAEIEDFCFKEIHRMFGNVVVEKHAHNTGITEIKYFHVPMAHDFKSWFSQEPPGEKHLPRSMYMYPRLWINSFLGGWNACGDSVWTEEEMDPANPVHRMYRDEIYVLCKLNRINPETFVAMDYEETPMIVEEAGDRYVQCVSNTVVDDDDGPDMEVYTLGVENDHSYSVEGIVAQNCYLISMESDSIEGIYNTLKDCALISKWAGGIGLHIHNIRATGSYIAGTNGTSNGIVPMLRVFNNTAKYVDQCLHPDTIIYTLQGPKKLAHVTPGETAIFNRRGQPEVIQNVLEHMYGENGGDDAFLEIHSEHALTPLCVTPEHPVYVYRGGEGAADLNDPRAATISACNLDEENCWFEWTEAKLLDTTDQIVYSIPTYEQDIPEITKDDCYVYGLFLSCGHMTYCDTIETKYLQIITFMTWYLSSRCVPYEVCSDDDDENDAVPPEEDIECGGAVVDEDAEDAVPSGLDEFLDIRTYQSFSRRISWKHALSLPFKHYDLYNEQHNKRVHPRWLNLPIDKSKYILKGIIDGGGTMERDFSYTNISQQIVESCRYLCLRMGVLTRGHVDADLYVQRYHLSIPATAETCALFEIQYDGRAPNFRRVGQYLLSPVTKVVPARYEGVLYDLQMKEEHNYLIHHGLVHNGGGKRNGSIAIYLEPWHADIELFLQMRKNHGEEELKARDLFYALWIPDLFMKRVKEAGKWTLFCPHECPGLADVYGDAFEALYTQYEAAGKGRATVQARDLWFKVLDSQMETGTPYMVFKDAANRKSNQKNLGTIKSSNLCSEIIEYSDEHETAVCNLASIALPSFVVKDDANPDAPMTYDFEKLHKVARMVTYNLNRIIDINYYPTEKTQTSNLRHRPIGIGVQGLADTFMMMGYTFGSPESRLLNQQIFETIYHGGLVESCELAKQHGPYASFAGSPASQGELQYDMWVAQPLDGRYDWDQLKNDIRTHGLRNSLLLAPMPTASTSQILGFNECIEPITSNIYSRRTMAGEFIITNKYLMKDLLALGLWNEKIKTHIIANNGSIQGLTNVPEHIREKYRTVWEIPMRTLIDMAADRGIYVDQSQSLNLWIEDPTYSTLTSMHFYSWGKGLKTGIYYLRRRAKHTAQQFTIEPEKAKHDGEDEDEICEMCSS